MKEQRRCHRLNLELPTSFKVFDTQSHVSVATTMDVSATGLCLLTKEKLSKGLKLTMNVTLPDGEKITVNSEVVWVKEILLFSKKEYKVGIRIDDSMKADEAKFVRFYAEQLKEFFSNKE